jgi:hypothetical protein
VCAGFGRVGQIVGRILGLFQPTPTDVKEQRRKVHKVDETRPRDETVTIDLLHRAVPAKHTDEGLRALAEIALFVLKSFRNTWRASSAKP